MAESTKAKIVKLNNSNYPNWKFKLELLLRKQNLWKKIIVGEKPAIRRNEAGAIINQRELDEYDEKDDEARGTIGLLVEDSQLALIRTKTTAKETWNALKEYHEKDTLTNKVSLMRAICKLKLVEGGDAKAHISEMQDLFTKLRDLGEEILSDKWSAAMLLSSLPESYDVLISSLETRKEEELTFGFVQNRVIAEYERHFNLNKNESNDSILKINGNIKCFFCKKGSHLKKDCFKYKKWQEKQNNNKGNGYKSDKIHSIEDTSQDFLFTMRQKGKEGWLIDSGATRHVVNNKNFFKYIDQTYKSTVELANGQNIRVEGMGIGILTLINEKGDICKIDINEVLYAPQLIGNVLSVRGLTKLGLSVEFNGRTCQIIRKDQQIGIADTMGELYILRQRASVCTVIGHNSYCIHQLHRKMGHRDPDAIIKMAKNNLIEGIKIIDCGIKETCFICMKGKLTKYSQSKTNAPLDLIHSDVCGPMRTMTPNGKRYIVTFIDDYSCFTIIRLIAHKSEVEKTFRDFVELCKTMLLRKPKIIRSDRGGEYTGKNLLEYLRSEGIQIQLTAPYSPQQNGIAERKNRTLIEMARCMLIDAKMPYKFWGEAISTANFIQNRVITRKTDTTPYERWNGLKPNIDQFQIFGSTCFVHVPEQKRHKLENTGVEMKFLGYDEQAKAYRCYNSMTRKVVISRDVRFCIPENYNKSEHYNKFKHFDESNYIPVKLLRNKPKEIIDEMEFQNKIHEQNIQEENHQQREHDIQEEHHEDEQQKQEIEVEIKGNAENIQEGINEERRISTRSNKGIPPNRYKNEIHLTKEIIEPKNYSEALESDQREHWLAAMQDEIESHQINNTWELVELPVGKVAIGGK